MGEAEFTAGIMEVKTESARPLSANQIGVLCLAAAALLGVLVAAAWTPTVLLLPAIPVLAVLIWALWKIPLLALTLLLVGLPFHSLAMRMLDVDLHLPQWALSVASVWKEFVLILLLTRLLVIGAVRRRKISSLDLLIALYALLGLPYIFVSSSLTSGFYGFRGTYEPFAFYLVGRMLPYRPPVLKRLLRYLLLVAILLSIFGLYQAYVLGERFLWKYRAEAGAPDGSHFTRIAGLFVIRVSSTFTSPNQMGLYLAILTLILVSLLLHGASRPTRAIPIILVFMVVLLATTSRSSWLALATGLCLIVLLRKRIKVTSIALAAVLLVLLIPFLLKFNVFAYVGETLSLTDTSAAGKIPSILSGLSFVYRNPLGIGLGMAGPRSRRFTGVLGPHSENYFVLLAMEVGVVGLALYLAIICAVSIRLHRRYVSLEHRALKAVALGTLAAVIGASVGNMFIPSLQEIAVAGYLWLFVGLGARDYGLSGVHPALGLQPSRASDDGDQA